MKPLIPVFSLIRHHRSIKRPLLRSFSDVMKRGLYMLGPEVAECEKKCALYIGRSFGVGVGSGTDALTFSIRALGLKHSDEVVVPANAYPTVFGIAQGGVSVRLSDCGENALIDERNIESVLTKHTKAVIAVHLYGNLVDVTRIRRFLNKIGRSDISIIEDMAQAFGAKFDTGESAGAFGSLACLSFYPSKNIGALGDGGMVVMDDIMLAKKIRALRMYGEESRYESTMISGVSRLDEIQAAFLNIELSYVDEWVARRQSIARVYDEGLSGIEGLSIMPRNKYSGCHLYVIRSARRDALQKYLTKHDIGTQIHYPIPIHLLKSFMYLGKRKGSYPIAETLSTELLSIPMYPELSNSQVQRIIYTIRSFHQSQYK